MAAQGAPPAWWSAGNPPVWDETLSVTPDVNKGVANIGQAKHMVQRALETLEEIDEGFANEIRTKLTTPQPSVVNPSHTNPPILDLAVPSPKTPEWTAKQKAPLLIGQLKSIGAPFYDALHEIDPIWIRTQLIENQTSDSEDQFNHYPWSSNTADDENKAPANIGQLKAVFSIDFDSFAATDSDDDGLTNQEEFNLGADPKDQDSDGDGVPDGEEVNNLCTDPLSSSDLDSDGLPDDYELYCAKQLLALGRTPAQWGPLYPGIVAGNLDPAVDYTDSGLTLAQFSTKTLSSQTPIRVEEILRITEGTTSLIHEPTSGGGYRDRPVGYFTHERINGNLAYTNMTAELVPNLEWFKQSTRARFWAPNGWNDSTTSSSLGSIRTTYDYRDITVNSTTTKTYHGRYEEVAYRVWGPKLVNEELRINYLVTTLRWLKNYDSTNGIIHSIRPLEIIVPQGQTCSDWKEVEPHIEESLTYSHFTTIAPAAIKQVKFGGGANYHELKSDDGKTTYAAPQWSDVDYDSSAVTDTATGERNYPVAFTKKTKPSIGAVFSIPYLPPGQIVKIRGIATDGLQVPETSVAVTPVGDVVLPLTPTSNDLPDTIKFHNADDDTAFTINWEIRHGNGDWCALGSTRHTLYITMANPISTAKSLSRETLFNFGCRNADGKGASEQEVVDAIYNGFRNRDVRRVKPSHGSLREDKMTYWGDPQKSRWNTEDLLADNDGKCEAWAKLLIDILRIQGIDAVIKRFEAPVLSKQELQTALEASFPQSIPTLHPNFEPTSILLVKMWDPDGNPFAPVDKPGVKAQGIDDPRSFFTNHSVVKYGGKYYDPSYGAKVYSSQLEWETESIAGYGMLFATTVTMNPRASTTPPLSPGYNIYKWGDDVEGIVETEEFQSQY